MDVLRLSHWLHLPPNFLREAAPGYLEPEIWDQTPDGDGWFIDALTYLTAPCRGVPGPLSRRRPLSDQHSDSDGYRLADYLEQVGHTERAFDIPPATFWTAAANASTRPGALTALGSTAQAQGLLDQARQLYRMAADRGDVFALWHLAVQREWVGDRAGAEALARESANGGNPGALWKLAVIREAAGDRASAEALARAAADWGHVDALFDLAEWRQRRGDRASAEALNREAGQRRQRASDRTDPPEAAGEQTQRNHTRIDYRVPGD